MLIAPRSAKPFDQTITELCAKPQVCQSAQVYLKKQKDYTSMWEDIVARNDVVFAYGWTHTTTGATERISQCLIELYGKFADHFPEKIAVWFAAIKLGDTSINPAMEAYANERRTPKVGKLFARGMLLILSKDYGDTGICISSLGAAISAAYRAKDSLEIAVLLDKTQAMALDILLKEFPNGV